VTSGSQWYACFRHVPWLDSSWNPHWSECWTLGICTLVWPCDLTCMLNQLRDTDLSFQMEKEYW
jgi:hypothetical protein